MRKHLLVAACAAVVILVGNAFAGVIPGRWEKVDTLDNGSDIVVLLNSGERFNADFRRSDLESITVKPMGQDERRIPKAEVKQIEREGVKQDGALDGAAIGAGAGALIGALLGSQTEEGEFRDASMLGLALAGAGAGFGLGYAVDSSRGKPILLYQALE